MTANEIDLSPDSLRKVAKKVKIEQDLKKLKVKTEKLKVRSEIEEIDISDEITKLDQEIADLTKAKEEFQSYKHPFLELFKKQDVLQKRIKKLEAKKGQIQTSVYDSLRNEYQEEQKSIMQQINQTTAQLREIKQGATKGAQSLKYSLEELSVRKEIEEIPEDTYQKQLAELKSELTQSEELETAIDFLLDMVKN
ncbi:MAG: hypothetical protein JSV04_02245 [Candidatus Heimdallarchaeota archaeon]|nr:MAG: hypothetical protein JSV04_02245 [Candidatus Heimdallarchaeota archaeon]